MTATVSSTPQVAPRLASRLVNLLLSIPPLANLAKSRARQMMIQRAESIGVSWTQEVETLKARDWTAELERVRNSAIVYPDYYTTSFHAYEAGNLGWEPALEVEVAAHAVHARIWPEGDATGDFRLRQSFHDILKTSLPIAPQAIVDLGCSVGMSTFALQATFPKAKLTGVDLSPYFLAVADYRTQQRDRGEHSHLPTAYPPNPNAPTWVHAPAEATGLPDQCCDLVSTCLMFHELPQTAAIAILREARRLLRPSGHFALMDMNPQSNIYAQMPPYILTLLKSTEPYLDQYFGLDLAEAIVAAGFAPPIITCNTPRHRTVIAQVKA